MTEASDVELIARVLVEDDRGAFGALVRRHQSAVRRYLRHLTRGDAAMADDLAQETFVTAWRGLARFQGRAGFLTWLLGIAHNHHRNARRRQEAPGADRSEAADESAPSPARAVALQQDLAGAMRQLDPGEQDVLHLFYQQGLTHLEIARVLHQPLGTVKTHLARGKEKLRRLLATWNPSN